MTSHSTALQPAWLIVGLTLILSLILVFCFFNRILTAANHESDVKCFTVILCFILATDGMEFLVNGKNALTNLGEKMLSRQ